MILDNWKKIKTSTTKDEYNRRSLNEDAMVSSVSNWKLGKETIKWNKFTDYVTPVDTHADSNAFLSSLKFNESKISYEDALEKLNNGDWDNERFNDAISDGEVEVPMEESSLDMKKDDVLFFIIRRKEDKKYLTLDYDNNIGWSDDLDDSEAFDTFDEAEDCIRSYLDTIELPEIITSIEDEIDREDAILDYKDDQFDWNYEVVRIYPDSFRESKMKESDPFYVKHLLDNIADQLKLNYVDKEMFIHDFNNLRADEWFDAIDEGCGPELSEAFRKLVLDHSKITEAGKGPQEYCIKLTIHTEHGFQDLYTCFDLYQDFNYSSFKERVENLPSLDDRQTAEETKHLVSKDYFNKYQDYPIIRIVKFSEEHLEESKLKESKELDIIIDFPIEVSPKGRIKANDAKKLLKYLTQNKMLRLGRTWFVKDSTGRETCWTLMKGYFDEYVFSCEITDSIEDENGNYDELDWYNGLSFSKNNGKLTDFEWESYKVK